MAARYRVIKAEISVHLFGPHLSMVSFSQVLCIWLQIYISNGWMADLVVVVAVTNPEAKAVAHGISLFLVENGTKGFHKGRKLEKIGQKAQVLELIGLGRLRFHLSSHYLFSPSLKGHS